VALLVVFGVQAGIFVVLFHYFQAVLGWSGLHATLALMPTALLMMVASGLAPRLSARIGGRPAMVTGIVSVPPGLLAMGLDMGLTMTPSTEAITSSLPHDRQGVASALNDVTRELGTALGVANAVAAGARSPALVHAAQQSFVDGRQQAKWVGAGVMAVLGVHILVQARCAPPKPAPSRSSHEWRTNTKRSTRSTWPRPAAHAAKCRAAAYCRFDSGLMT
jgi:hypothetical protein